MIAGLALVALFSSTGAAAVTGQASGHAQAATDSWGTAALVPGTAALNQDGDAEVLSVSCASVGNCGAGGSFEDAAVHLQAFVVTESHGGWGTAVEVPGTAGLNKGGAAWVASVSCASAGECSAGGSYTDSSGHVQAFVATEAGGRWQSAVTVPGIEALNAGGSAKTASVSCAAPGDCGAGGSYTDAAGHIQAFVASEMGGQWRSAVQVPGTAALNAGGSAKITSVSCAAAGECTAGGSYADGSYLLQALVVSETDGKWGAATELPGSAALNTGGAAWVTSVSCASPGNCGAGGSYTDDSFFIQAFVASEKNGQWGDAIKVPGTAALNSGGTAKVTSVSCASAGNCAAGGSYTDGSFHVEGFVVNETDDKWGDTVEVPGTEALNVTGNGAVTSVSCASANNCGAGGMYDDAGYKFQAFVVDQR